MVPIGKQIVLRSESAFRQKSSAVVDNPLPTALYRLKTSEMRQLLLTIKTLTIVSIPTWETQHKRYSAERCTLLETLLTETLLSALVEQYYVDKNVFIEVKEDENHYLTFTKALPETRPPEDVFHDASPAPKSSLRARRSTVNAH